jgi:uncharacterized protein (DUF2252 family)
MGSNNMNFYQWLETFKTQTLPQGPLAWIGG